MPLAPFWLVNIAAALAHAPLRAYALATFLGIMPATFIYSGIGAGIGELIARGETPDAGVVFVAHTSAMQSFVADFSAATLHSALVDHLSAGEEPTVSDHHLLPSLLAPVAETAVAIGLYGDIVLRTYWSEEGDDITASTDLPTLERESRRH